jgi:hypothetical protein
VPVYYLVILVSPHFDGANMQVHVRRATKSTVLQKPASAARILGWLNVLIMILIHLDGHVENLARLLWIVMRPKWHFRMERYNVISVKCYVIMAHVHLVKSGRPCHVTVENIQKKSIVQRRKFQRLARVRRVTNRSHGWGFINVKMSVEGKSPLFLL